MDQKRIDDPPDILDHQIFEDLQHSSFGIDRYMRQMNSVRVGHQAGIKISGLLQFRLALVERYRGAHQ